MSVPAPTRVHRRLTEWGAGLLARFGRMPWWAQALTIWMVSRAWAFVIFAVVDRQAPDGPWGRSPLGYLGFVSIWDGTWYQSVHDHGYPDELPRGASGTVAENPWAFYPLFPMVVRAVTAWTGLPWAVCAPTVALVAGFLAAVLILRLFQQFLSHATALWALAVVAFGPVSPVFQAAYAESLHLALLAGVLLLLLRGHLLPAAPLILLMCLTRPAGVPFAAALGVFWVVRSVSAVRRRRHRPWWRLLDRWFWLALWSCACALLWPGLAWAVTGEPGAYTDTETAWRATALVPFEPWLTLGSRFFGPALGWLAVLVAAGAFALLITTRAVRGVLPSLLWLWVVCYAVYLAAFLHPQSSTFRLLVPLFVLAGPLAAVSDSRAFRWTLVIVGAMSQIVWIGYLWQWSPLPGGGDYPP
ncbi:hypothetical protein [Kocuria coralli]|nr:hypothetical protein [Kocuria coralli]